MVQGQQQRPDEAPMVECPSNVAAPAPPVTPNDLKSIYPLLKPGERRTLTQCRTCSKEFHFVSEHLIHLKKHFSLQSDVNSYAEMRLKIWVQG